jgi:hypothetical protein
MSARNRKARRFQLEAMEPRWAPGGMPGGVLAGGGTHNTSAEISQAHVDPSPSGGAPGGVLGGAPGGVLGGSPGGVLDGGLSGGVLGD